MNEGFVVTWTYLDARDDDGTAKDCTVVQLSSRRRDDFNKFMVRYYDARFVCATEFNDTLEALGYKLHYGEISTGHTKGRAGRVSKVST